jgi:hypothetical protein
VDICPTEPGDEESTKFSLWEVVKTIDAPVMNQRQGRSRGQATEDDSDISRVNLWDIVYAEEAIEIPKAFGSAEKERLLDVFALLYSKHALDCIPFLERVEEALASDYRSFVPSEMWLKLIEKRI